MEKVQAGQELAKGVASVAKEAERFIARISKQLRERAERQAETALGEYEQRIQQIVAQTREELNSRSLEVADQIRQAILLKAEQASTSLVETIVTEIGKRAGELAKRVLKTAEQETEPVSTEAATTSKDDDRKDIGGAEYKSARMAAEFEHRIENLGTQAEPEVEDNADQTGQGPQTDSGESEIEDFIRYLSQ